MLRIAVLAMQGAFIEHERMLERLGVETFEVRQLADWQQPKDGLVIPGGESTVQLKLLRELGLFAPVQQAVREDSLPVFGTCAGLILLARQVKAESPMDTLAAMDIAAVRNAYGRQLGSFYAEASVHGVGDRVPMTFIRAPYIDEVYGAAEPLAVVNGHVVAARQVNMLVTSFHPELNEDTRIHQYFLDIIQKKSLVIL